MVVGNWKMNGNGARSDDLCAQIVAGFGSATAAGGAVELVVCPPVIYLERVVRALVGSGIGIGAQNVAAQADGAFTGEISAAMVADAGCGFAIIGHSERRTLFGDTDEVVAAKVARCIGNGLTPIVCVGETLAEREAGHTEAVLSKQVDAICGALAVAGEQSVIAYEPVWAIGTGKVASPGVAQAAHAFIRGRLVANGLPAAATRILYGGSVKPDNAASLFALPDIDGGLIGGASLVAADFVAIGRAAQASAT